MYWALKLVKAKAIVLLGGGVDFKQLAFDFLLHQRASYLSLLLFSEPLYTSKSSFHMTSLLSKNKAGGPVLIKEKIDR